MHLRAWACVRSYFCLIIDVVFTHQRVLSYTYYLHGLKVDADILKYSLANKEQTGAAADGLKGMLVLSEVSHRETADLAKN